MTVIACRKILLCIRPSINMLTFCNSYTALQTYSRGLCPRVGILSGGILSGGIMSGSRFVQ